MIRIRRISKGVGKHYVGLVANESGVAPAIALNEKWGIETDDRP